MSIIIYPYSRASLKIISFDNCLDSHSPVSTRSRSSAWPIATRFALLHADDYCSVIQLNRHIGVESNTLLAQFLGVDCRDQKWWAPDGRDCTVLCEMSDLGGFDSRQDWTLDGWILSDRSMDMLRAEFHDHFRMWKKSLKKKLILT